MASLMMAPATPPPPKGIVMGEPGTFKTTLAADLGLLILPFERGYEYIVPRPQALISDPLTGTIGDYDALIQALDSLAAGGHGFTGVAIDTVNALEKTVWRKMCSENGMPNVEGVFVDFNKTKTMGYSKGYKISLNYWHNILVRLDALQAQGLMVLLLGHTVAANTFDQDLEQTSEWSLAVHKDLANTLIGWADYVWMAAFERRSRATDDGRKVPVPTQTRVLYCSDRSTARTKTRILAPDKIAITVGNPEVKAVLAPYLAPWQKTVAPVAETTADPSA